MKKPRNAAARKSVITIRVETVDLDRWVCTYRNYHEKNGKVWRFFGMLQVDRDIIETLEPGKGYSIVQAVDEFNTTHWTHVAPYNGRNRLQADAIMEATAREKAKRVVNENFLDDKLGQHGFEF